jgi:hypothetical protein
MEPPAVERIPLWVVDHAAAGMVRLVSPTPRHTNKESTITVPAMEVWVAALEQAKAVPAQDRARRLLSKSYRNEPTYKFVSWLISVIEIYLRSG